MVKKVLKQFFMRYHYIIYISLSFLILDFYIRYFNRGISFVRMIDLSPNFFTLAWVLFFIAINLLLKPKIRKIVYLTFVIFLNILLLVNYIYYGVFNTFFSFKLFSLAGEGMTYLNTIFSYIRTPLILVVIFSIFFAIIGCRFAPKDVIKKDKMVALSFVFLAFFSYSLARLSLGEPAKSNQWDIWNYKRNVYQNFTDTRKSLQTAGFYEYMIRDMYLTTVSKLSNNKKSDKEELDKYFAEKAVKDSNNEWANKFKDKNVILVLMESIDNWLVTEETMPTVYNMMQEGINFTNHFSPIYNSGATFNAEFMANTGYMTPLNEEIAANKYNQNVFPQSLASLFTKDGYSANAFHMNYGSFYNRQQLSMAMGYNRYYGSLDMDVDIKAAVNDTHFMTNHKLKNLILPDNKFMNFVITYSAHTPYLLNSLECSSNITDEDKQKIKDGADEEEICIKAQARQTDNFFKLLIDNLKKDNKLDNTVIIGFTDHMAYGYTDREKVFNLKDTHDMNLASKVPFFIWNNNIDHLEINKVNSDIDILPTIANLFGLDWDSKYYIGQNILNDNYDNIVFFSDYSWYDGNVYYKDKNIELGNNVSNEYIDYRNKQVSNILEINKKVLDSDYFNQQKKEKDV